jgi:hypothetical protein
LGAWTVISSFDLTLDQPRVKGFEIFKSLSLEFRGRSANLAQ